MMKLKPGIPKALYADRDLIETRTLEVTYDKSDGNTPSLRTQLPLLDEIML